MKIILHLSLRRSLTQNGFTGPQAILDPESNQILALLYLNWKKEVSFLFKPTPILNHERKLIGILGNLLDKASTPVITKIDADEVGFCFTIQNFNDIPEEFCPEPPLIIDMVKDTAWESALNDIALCALPSLVPILFGFQIESCYYNEAFIDEMKKISPEHRFWAKIFTDVIEQTETDSDTVTIVQRLMTSKTTSTLRRDPCRSATKNFRNMTAASGPFIEFSLVGNKFTSEQASVKTFFRRNPKPVRAVFLDEEDNNPTAEIPIHTTTTTADTTPLSPVMALPPLPAGLPPIGSAPPKCFAQLIQTMKSLQAPQLPPKIIVESRDHQESVDLAKLQTSMLKLMYVSGDINWDEATIKNIRLAFFLKGFKNLLDRTASVQVTQLSNLFVTVFTSEPEDDDDDTAINPLNRLMSLFVFPQKFTKAHLNASFQSVDLETGTIYKSTSINPFHYTPQTNRVLVKAANSEMEEERNETNSKIVEKDRKQISSVIEGVGHITSMNDVTMTCANVCGVQLVIVDVSTSKPILYQFAWKLIKFIENKKKQKPGCATIKMQSRTCRWFSWGSSTNSSNILLHSPRTQLTPTKLK